MYNVHKSSSVWLVVVIVDRFSLISSIFSTVSTVSNSADCFPLLIL